MMVALSAVDKLFSRIKFPLKLIGWAAKIGSALIALFLLLSFYNVYSFREGHITTHPEIKTGDAFDAFFAEPRWKFFTGENGESVIEITGDCEYLGDRVTALIQFVDDGNDQYSAEYLSFDGEPQTEFILGLLINAIYQSYEDSGVY